MMIGGMSNGIGSVGADLAYEMDTAVTQLGANLTARIAFSA
jgi:hypothetical protein